MSIRRIRSATIAAALALAVSATAQAANLFWQGGAGDISSSNYYNGSPNVAPATGDYLFIGANVLATGLPTDADTLTVGKLYIGQNSTDGGSGAVTISAGSFTANSGGGSSSDYATIVGNQNTGALTIDGANTNYTTNGLTVGYGDDPALSATFTLINSTKVTVNGGRNLAIGETAGGGVGIPGQVNIQGGTLKIGGILQVGLAAPYSSYTQTGGAASSDNVVVGPNGTDHSSFSLSGGSYKTTSTFNIANDPSFQSDSTSVSFSGGTVNIVGMNLAASSSSNTSVSFSGNVAFTDSANLTLAYDSGSATNTSMTVADTASVTITNSLFIGRGASTNTSLTMTGGSVTITNNFLMGTGASASAIVVNHSAGSITTLTPLNASTGNPYNFAIGDTTTGDSTYNLSGSASINTVAAGVVGRQHGAATMNQSGGTANFNNSLHIGDSQSIAPADYATGIYNLSGGSLNASVTLDGSSAEAFSIAPAGTGTLHIIGDGATMTVTGNMGVYANTNGGSNTGTLAYTLQTGESLTEINVTGTATFSLGSILSLDLNSTTPTQSSYDLLTAADIIDNGLVFSAPAGWNFQIITGGNGEILQAFTTPTRLIGDTNGDGAVDLTDLNNVLNNFGVNATGNPGDDNMDGMVDLTDLNDVLNNFGTHSPAASALSVVPEPTTLSLLSIGTLGLLARRRRRA